MTRFGNLPRFRESVETSERKKERETEREAGETKVWNVVKKRYQGESVNSLNFPELAYFVSIPCHNRRERKEIR